MTVQPVFEPRFRDLAGRFVKASKTIDKDVQTRVKNLGARWVEIAQSEAPRKTGTFASSIRYYPFTDGDTFGFKGVSQQPLGSYIKFGTKPHAIRARNAGALRFFWVKTGLDTIVPKRGGFKTHKVGNALFIGKGRVDHPGTKPNPYHLRAFEKWFPEVQTEVRSLTKEFVIRLAEPNE